MNPTNGGDHGLERQRPPQRRPRPVSPPIDLDENSGPGIDIRAMARKYWLLVAAMLVLGVGLAVVNLVFDTPTYRANVIVEVKALADGELRGKGDLLAPSFDTSLVNVQTQVKLLQAGPTTRQVYSELMMQPPPRPLDGGLFTELRRRFRPETTNPIHAQQVALMHAAQTFDARQINGTRLIELLCESTHPEVAAQFVNEVAREFVQDSDKQRNEGLVLGSKILQTQLQETQKMLEKSEEELRQFVQKSRNMVGITDITIDDARVRQLQADIAAAQADRLRIQSKYDAARKVSANNALEVVGDAHIQTLQAKLADLGRDKAVLLMTLTPSHYKVQRIETQEREIKQEIGESTDKVLSSLKNELDRAIARETLLSRAYSGSTSRVASHSEELSTYQTLKRRVETLRTNMDGIQQRLSQSSAGSTTSVGPLRMVGQAEPPQLPYKPRPALALSMGAFGGILLAVGIAFVREKMDSRLKDPGSIREVVKVRELGVIPAAKEEKGWRKNPVHKLLPGLMNPDMGFDRSPSQLVAHMAWVEGSHVLVESLRSTLTSLLHEAGDHSKVTMVTSASSGEGKTTAAVNLAIAMAQTGRRVLLVDADFRKSSIAAVFNLVNPPSLAHILQEDRPVTDYRLDEMVVPGPVHNLSIMATTIEVKSIARILNSVRLREVMDRLRTEFDVVLVDAAPILPIADTRLLGHLVDGAVLVVRSGVTQKHVLSAACQCLMEDGIRLFGTILNDWRPEGNASSYYYGYQANEKD